MPPDGGRVIRLDARSARWSSEASRSPLHEAVDKLDDLRDALAQIEPQSTWSAEDWSRESMPLSMRLRAMERQLGLLGQVDPAEWPDTDWALDLDEARTVAEESLEELLAALAALRRSETPLDERAWQARRFERHLDAVLDAVQRLQALVTAWYPAPGEAR